MKRGIHKLLAMALVLVALCSIISPALAAAPPELASPDASYYISNVYAEATGTNGTVYVYFSIMATGKMSSLGATSIILYNSGGQVASKYYLTTTGMMGSNQTFYSNTIPFYGLSSGSYFAEVYFKASNSSGYDTTSYTTGWSY